MDGVGGYAGWRWIFILEGLLTVVVALVAPFAIHDSPETASFLTEEERRFVIHSLRIQNSADAREMVQDEAKFQTKYVIDAFLDWQIWLGLFSKHRLPKVELESTNTFELSVLGNNLSSIWDLLVSSFHNQGSWLCVFDSPTFDGKLITRPKQDSLLITLAKLPRSRSISPQQSLLYLQHGSQIDGSSGRPSSYSSWL